MEPHNPIGTAFRENTIIDSFVEEMLNFTGLPNTYNSIYYQSSIRLAICPPNITSIYQRTFQACRNLLACAIPASCTSWGDLCFYNATSLKALILFSKTPMGYFRQLQGCPTKLYVPDDSVDTYKGTWTSFVSRIYGHSQLAIDYPEYYERFIHIYD